MYLVNDLSSEHIEEMTRSLFGLEGGAERFRNRLCQSADKVRAVSTWVGQYFERELRKRPLPKSALLAVFASGSAARLEMYGRPDNSRRRRGGRAKDQRSDVDILCVVDGLKDERRRIALLKGLVKYLTARGNKGYVACAPVGFECVALDAPSRHPLGAFQHCSALTGKKGVRLKQNLSNTIDEDRRRETWRYWVVFESALLYAYPTDKGAAFATALERRLMNDYFDLHRTFRDRRYPLLWYQAACRYMSEIYIGDLRKLATYPDRATSAADMMRKAVKLKSARVLTWSLSLTNATLIYQLNALGFLPANCRRPCKSQNCRFHQFLSLARRPGLIRSLQLLGRIKERLEELDGLPEARGHEKEYEFLQEAADQYGPVMRMLVDTYELYFNWLERGGRPRRPLSRREVWEFVEGQPTAKVPVTNAVVALARDAATLFNKVKEDCRDLTGFAPESLY